MKFSQSICIAICAAALITPLSAYADEKGGCDDFAWSVKTELQWMKAADSEAVTSGAKLQAAPAKAITLALQPMDKVAFPVAPTSRKKPAAANGGFITFDSIGEPGTYQVSLAARGWIDIIQDGKPLKSSAHTGKSECDGVRKSVRFPIAPGPVVIEISGVEKDSIKLTVRREE
jgi:hypothetical protein